MDISYFPVTRNKLNKHFRVLVPILLFLFLFHQKVDSQTTMAGCEGDRSTDVFSGLFSDLPTGAERLQFVERKRAENYAQNVKDFGDFVKSEIISSLAAGRTSTDFTINRRDYEYVTPADVEKLFQVLRSKNCVVDDKNVLVKGVRDTPDGGIVAYSDQFYQFSVELTMETE